MVPETPSPVGPPATPDGYDAPGRFEYPFPVLLAGMAVLLPLSAVVFGAVLVAAQGPAAFDWVVSPLPAPEVGFVFDLGSFGLSILVAVSVTTVVHERIHGLVYEHYGYEVDYGIALQLGAAYAVAFRQFQRREHVLPMAAAPLLVIDLLALSLLFVPVPVVAFTAYLALLLNTAGSVGDLYILWRVGRLPEGTLLYDADLRHSYFFEPAPGGVGSSPSASTTAS